MTCHSAVAVYDNLTSCQSAVTVRSADNEASCRIDEELRILIDHLFIENRIKYMFFDIFMDLLLCDCRIMLCGKYHCLQTSRLSFFIILYCHLGFSIRAEIRECPVFSYLCKLLCKLVRKGNRIRHILFCLIGRISEHHTLITGTDRFDLLIGHLVFFCFQRFINAHCNIG